MMNMKRLIVLLLCLLAVFAVVSCANEPGKHQEKKPASGDKITGSVYFKLTATRGAKRIVALRYVGGEDGINPKEGDVLTLKYRSSHPVTRLYLRSADDATTFLDKYDIASENDPFVSGADEDGWVTFTYQFPATMFTAEITSFPGIKIEFANYLSGEHAEGKGMFEAGDYIEIKEFYFNDDLLAIDGPEDATTAKNYQSDEGVWNRPNTDHTWPVLEVKPL